MPGTGYQDGVMVGYDGEILQRVADTLKLKVKPALMEWSGTIASVQSSASTSWQAPWAGQNSAPRS
jgi:polar amino acid transport system substrate-binding protein